MPKTDHRVSLTDRKLQSLKPAPAGERYQVMDLEVPAFGVRVTDSGVRTFIYRARFPGGKHASRREIGQYPVISLATARSKAREWRILLQQGIDPAAREEQARAENARKQEATFKAVAEDWFKEKLATERKGADVEREVRNEFFPKLAKSPVDEVTEEDIREIIKAKKQTAPSQARNLLGHAKRFFAWAIDQRCYGLTKSPCAELKAAKIIGKKRRRQRILTDDELFALWRAALRTPYPAGPIYRLLILNALRLNEVVDAAKPELDRRNRVWVIPEERMKGRAEEARPHAVPLTAAALAILDDLPRFNGGQYLFSTTFGETPVWIGSKAKNRLDQRMLRTLRALARVRGDDPASVAFPPWVNHDIRRTVRSHLSRLKVTEEAREAVLAHVRPGIKGVYDVHDYMPEKLEALELWAARLREIVDPMPSNVVKFAARA